MKVQDRIQLFFKRENFQPEAFEVCPRFQRCNVNRCPLHKDYPKLKMEEADKEKRCKVPKKIRREIGEFLKLKNRGLREAELSGLKRWESLSPEEQECKREETKKRFHFTKQSIQKEYNTIYPSKTDVKTIGY